MLEVPCTPHFVSSLVFPCRYPSEDVEDLVTKIPYFLFETYLLTLKLFHFAFHWAIVFLGLAWTRKELQNSELTTNTYRNVSHSALSLMEFEWKFLHYRTCQSISNRLTEAFHIYLVWFPTFLLGMMSLVLFATLKLWYIPFHAYLLFPACWIRCSFEAFTPLGIAGKVHEKSQVVLRDRSRCLSIRLMDPAKLKWFRAFHRSCPVIACGAGSLYTFENSIVMCTLNNCIHLTTNLLLMSS